MLVKASFGSICKRQCQGKGTNLFKRYLYSADTYFTFTLDSSPSTRLHSLSLSHVYLVGPIYLDWRQPTRMFLEHRFYGKSSYYSSSGTGKCRETQIYFDKIYAIYAVQMFRNFTTLSSICPYIAMAKYSRYSTVIRPGCPMGQLVNHWKYRFMHSSVHTTTMEAWWWVWCGDATFVYSSHPFSDFMYKDHWHTTCL